MKSCLNRFLSKGVLNKLNVAKTLCDHAKRISDLESKTPMDVTVIVQDEDSNLINGASVAVQGGETYTTDNAGEVVIVNVMRGSLLSLTVTCDGFGDTVWSGNVQSDVIVITMSTSPTP